MQKSKAVPHQRVETTHRQLEKWIFELCLMAGAIRTHYCVWVFVTKNIGFLLSYQGALMQQMEFRINNATEGGHHV